VEGEDGSGEDEIPVVERVCVIRRPSKNEMQHIYIFIRSMCPAWITDSRSPFFSIVRILEDFLMGGLSTPFTRTSLRLFVQLSFASTISIHSHRMSAWWPANPHQLFSILFGL
jgi:hypothetical protein